MTKFLDGSPRTLFGDLNQPSPIVRGAVGNIAVGIPNLFIDRSDPTPTDTEAGLRKLSDFVLAGGHQGPPIEINPALGNDGSFSPDLSR